MKERLDNGFITIDPEMTAKAVLRSYIGKVIPEKRKSEITLGYGEALEEHIGNLENEKK